MPDTMQRLGILDIPMTIAEQQLLYGLTRDPGYPVLIRVLKAAAMKTTEEGIKTNTTDKDLIYNLHLEARATNTFCTRVIATLEYDSLIMESIEKAKEDGNLESQVIDFTEMSE